MRVESGREHELRTRRLIAIEALMRPWLRKCERKLIIYFSLSTQFPFEIDRGLAHVFPFRAYHDIAFFISVDRTRCESTVTIGIRSPFVCTVAQGLGLKICWGISRVSVDFGSIAYL